MTDGVSCLHLQVAAASSGSLHQLKKNRMKQSPAQSLEIVNWNILDQNEIELQSLKKKKGWSFGGADLRVAVKLSIRTEQDERCGGKMLHNFKPLFSGSVSVLSLGPCSMQGQTICLSIQNHIAAHGFPLYLPPSWLLALSRRYPPPISLLSGLSLIAFKILHGNRMLFCAVFLTSLGIKFPL